MKNKVYIVVLTWNGLDYTKQTLDSLFEKTTYDNYEVVVVDNASTDGTKEYLRSLDNITLYENEENLGFVRGNNVAIDKIKDGDIVLLNNDMIIIQEDWLDKMQETAYSADDIGVVGCRLINEEGMFLHAGTVIYPETYWGQQVGGGQDDVGQYQYDRDVQGIVFACAYIKREVLDKVGGLNEKFFSYFEDTDYCLQVKDAGYRIVNCGEATMIHYQNVSTSINDVSFNDMFLKSQETFKGIWGEKLENRHTRKLAWHSIVNFPSGYGVSSKNIMCALDEKDVDVRYKYVYGPDTPFKQIEPEMGENYTINVIHNRPFDETIPQVVYGQGDVFYKNTGKYKIGYTMLETTGIPKEWVNQANQMDEVWVPSTFNVKTFRDSGVTVPIYVIPLGVDYDFFNPKIRSHRINGKYVFLSVFEWGERKAPEKLLRAYTKAFSKNDDVLLICKIFNNDGSISVKEEIEKLNLPKDGPDIYIIHNHRLNDYQMSSLYASADCFVLPTRGEGWGMPILEAMACGLPTIATDWSSQTDFFNEKNGYPIRVDKLVDAEAKCPYYDGFQWADPSEEHLEELMKYVYTHQEEAKEKGLKASEEVREKWSWKNTADKIIERLDEINEKLS
ncbi:MAG: glycosyltransferase [Lachnospiraceae bacterium]|nr:glycosyltransferase [Lachnospiraceae bacterium]